MDRWSPAALVGLVIAGLLVIAWLFIRLIANLRQNTQRYFWFELSGSLLLISFGLFWLLGYPVASWAWRLPFVAVVLAGGVGTFRALSRRVPNV